MSGQRGSGPGGSGQGGSGQGGSAAGPVDPVRQAKDICLRLLTSRPRTQVELEQAMRNKEVAEEVIEQVVARLGKAGLIDDAAFAELWVRSRHTHQGLGRRALAAELRRKGVEPEAASAALSTVDGEVEERRARELVRRKLRLTAGKDEATRIRRLVGMLARKGYPEGLAFRVVREELSAAGEETELLDQAGGAAE